MGFQLKQNKGFVDTEAILKRLSDDSWAIPIIESACSSGISLLAAATPKDSGITSESWSYDILHDRAGGAYRIEFLNSSENDGYNVAILLQYGHATRSGTFVSGVDYINPASKSIFNSLAHEIWQEVLRACRK